MQGLSGSNTYVGCVVHEVHVTVTMTENLKWNRMKLSSVVEEKKMQFPEKVETIVDYFTAASSSQSIQIFNLTSNCWSSEPCLQQSPCFRSWLRCSKLSKPVGWLANYTQHSALDSPSCCRWKLLSTAAQPVPHDVTATKWSEHSRLHLHLHNNLKL